MTLRVHSSKLGAPAPATASPVPELTLDASATAAAQAPTPAPGDSRFVGAKRSFEALGVAAASGKKARVPVRVAPKSMSEAQKYRYYARIIRQQGGTLPKDRAVVLGIRGMSVDGKKHAVRYNRNYDDTFVVLTPKGKVFELRGATHPSRIHHPEAVDADGDGKLDVGMVRPGYYRCVSNPVPYKGGPSYHIWARSGSKLLPGYRDTDHDGKISQKEREASLKRRDMMSYILFHPGDATAPRSIGCQTLSPPTFDRFMGAVGGRRASFDYVLANAS